MIDLEQQIQVACEKYSNLHIDKSSNGYILAGKIVLNAEYNDVPLYDEYDIEINISDDFPNSIPVVKDIGETIPKELDHINEDGSLCLGATCEILDYITRDRTIVGFIDSFVMSYLYTCSYFIRYHKVPFGERKHGVKGIEEAYMERYNCASRELLIELLTYMCGIKRYRGHMLCVCGSGKKFRNCHGRKIVEDINSEAYELYKLDGYYILYDFLRKES